MVTGEDVVDEGDGTKLNVWMPAKRLNILDGQAPYHENVVSLFSYLYQLFGIL